MSRKLGKLLTLVLLLLLVLSTVVIAGQVVSATVSKTDPDKERITLMTNDGKVHRLQASKHLQLALKPGDKVLAEIDGTQVTALRMVRNMEKRLKK